MGVTVHVIRPQIGLLRPLTEEGLVGPELAPGKCSLLGQLLSLEGSLGSTYPGL